MSEHHPTQARTTVAPSTPSPAPAAGAQTASPVPRGASYDQGRAMLSAGGPAATPRGNGSGAGAPAAAARKPTDRELVAQNARVLDRIREKLSRSALDWAITDAEATEALLALATLGDAERRAVAAELERGGYLDRLFDNLPGDSQKKFSRQVIRVYQAMPTQALERRVEQLLSLGVFDWAVTAEEALAVVEMLKVMSPASREKFVYRENGKWYERLMRRLPPEKQAPAAQPAAQGGSATPQSATPRTTASAPSTATAQAKAPAKEKPGALARVGAGVETAVGVIRGDVDLNTAQVAAGGDLGGIEIGAAEREGGNHLTLDLDMDAGTFTAAIASLNIANVNTAAGTTKVKTGPGRLQGLKFVAKWATPKDGSSKLELDLTKLTLGDIQLIMSGVTVLIRSLVLGGLAVVGSKAPGSAKPTSKAQAIGLIATQIGDALARALPGIGATYDSLVDQPEGILGRLKQNFGEALDVSVSLADAHVEGVSTSKGDRMGSLDVKGLKVSRAFVLRSAEIRAEIASLKAKPAQDSAARERIAFLERELQRLAPLEQERAELQAKQKQGELSIREKDRLTELMNETTQGVASLNLQSAAAKDVRANGTQAASADVQAVSARVTGRILDRNELTEKEKLDRRLGLTEAPTPDASDVRASLQVGGAHVNGLERNGATVQDARISGLSAEVRNAGDPKRIAAEAQLQSGSATGIAVGGARVQDVAATNVRGSFDQQRQTASATAQQLSASGVQHQAGSLRSGTVQGASVQVRDYGNAETRAVTAGADAVRLQGARANGQGSAETLSAEGLRLETAQGERHVRGGFQTVEASGVEAQGNRVQSARLRDGAVTVSDARDAQHRAITGSLGHAEATGVRTAQGTIGSASAHDLSVRTTNGERSASAQVGGASVRDVAMGGVQVQQGTVAGIRAEGHDLRDADRRALTASVQSGSVSGVRTAQGTVGSASARDLSVRTTSGERHAVAELGGAQVRDVAMGGVGVREGSVSGLRAEGRELRDADRRALSASMQSANVSGVTTRQGSIGGASMTDLSVRSSQGERHAAVDLGSASVRDVDVAGARVQSGNLSGVHAEGRDLRDADRRALSASLDHASLQNATHTGPGGLRSSATALDVNGVSASTARGERDIDASIQGLSGSGIRVKDAQVGRATATGITASATDVMDPTRRQGRASVQDVRASDIAFTDPAARSQTAVRDGRVQGVGAQFGPNGTSVDAASVSAQGISDRRTLANGTRQQAQVADVSAQGAHYSRARTSSDYELSARQAHVGQTSVQQGEHRVGLNGLDVANGRIAQQDGHLRGGASQLDAQRLSYAGPEDRRASLQGASVRGAAFDLDTQRQRLDSARVDQVALQGGSYADRERSASFAAVGVRDVDAQGLGRTSTGAPVGTLRVGNASAQDLRGRQGDTSVSVASASVDRLGLRGDGQGNATAQLGGASVRDARATLGAAGNVNIGAADLQQTRAAASGLQTGGRPSLVGAQTNGLTVSDVRADVTPARLLGMGQTATGVPATRGPATTTTAPQGTRTATTAAPQPTAAQAASQQTAAPRQPAEGPFRAEPLAGLTGSVTAVLPVKKPIETVIRVFVPVQGGRVNLDKIDVDATGFVGSIAAATCDLAVSKKGALIIDVPGPWNVTIMEPGKLQGLVTKQAGGGKYGSIDVRPLVEGLMKPQATPDEGGGEPVRTSAPPRATASRTAARSNTPTPQRTATPTPQATDGPLDLGSAQISINGLQAGDGRIGTDRNGLTLDRGGDPNANRVEVSARLGESAHIGAQHLRATDLHTTTASGMRVESQSVDSRGLSVQVDKPLDEQRRIRAHQERLDVGRTTVGDREALDRFQYAP